MARKFNSANPDYFDFGSLALLKFTRNFSVAAWVNLSATGAFQAITSFVGGGFYLRINNANKVNFLCSQTVDVLSGATALTSGTWYHVGATIDNNATSNVVVYLNGVSDATGTTTQTFNNPTGNVRIAFDFLSEAMNGTLAHIAVWSGVLTAGDMLALAKGALPYRVQGVATLKWWVPLQGIVAAETDFSGNVNNNAITHGSPTQANDPPVNIWWNETWGTQPLSLPTPVVKTYPPVMGEVWTGPPIRGAPFQLYFPLEQIKKPELPPLPPPSGPAPIMPEVVAGPPMRGVPWISRYIEQEPSQTLLTSSDRPAAPKEILDGPPLVGAPWFRLPSLPLLKGDPPGTLPPIIGVRTYAPEITGGPIFGAPWNGTPHQELTQQVGPAPTPPGVPSYAPEINLGPPMPAPWILREVLSPPIGQVPTPFVPQPVGLAPRESSNVTLLPRDPVQDPRMRRFVDLQSQITNSLLRQGFIQETSPGLWILTGGAFKEPRDPGAADDVTIGANVGTFWINTLNKGVWVCVQNVIGSAIWKKIG